MYLIYTRLAFYINYYIKTNKIFDVLIITLIVKIFSKFCTNRVILCKNQYCDTIDKIDIKFYGGNK